MTHKVCRGCEVDKPASEYYKDSRTKSGLYSRCKECHKSSNQNCLSAAIRNEPTPHRVANYYFDAINGRITRGYRGAEMHISKSQMLEFVTKNWEVYMTLFRSWKESGWNRKLAPSIDRLDTFGNYTLDNIRLVTVSENSRKSVGERIERQQLKQH